MDASYYSLSEKEIYMIMKEGMLTFKVLKKISSKIWVMK